VPLLRSQSGMAIQTRPSGIPEEKARSETAAVRGDFIAAAIALKAPGFRGGDAAGGAAGSGGAFWMGLGGGWLMGRY
jgi:hypothetical protein